MRPIRRRPGWWSCAAIGSKSSTSSSANRKQLRGNIYLAKVTRVEPSLQAAFVDYGGNRHGFLAFSEIHPDYYQIPVADRQALIAEEEREHRAADVEADHRAGGRRQGRRERPARRPRDEIKSEPAEAEALDDSGIMAAGGEQMLPQAGAGGGESPQVTAEDSAPPTEPAAADESAIAAGTSDMPIELAKLDASSAAEPIPTIGGGSPMEFRDTVHAETQGMASHIDEAVTTAPADTDDAAETESAATHEASKHHETSDAHAGEENGGGNITEVNGNGAEGEEEVIESVGGADAMEEVPERTYRSRRQYKIQEVIKRRQVMLVQVVKEERGTKGAALTTYLSLAGRYSVLMPNTARGGGISRKITAAEDRRKLKEIAQELEVPEGMGVILRTAGATRTKTEVKRDFEYLLRLWETVRDLTLKSTAPMLVYEEGSLVKRSIRDLYNKDIDEIIVAGDEGHTDAKEFMRMLMPSHAKNVKRYNDTLPIFTRFGIESQLDAMFQPVMQLRSGGYIVINQTEALVAIDVNSGRATREHHIEDTALKTNVEAAEEIARQLRLRDLAGLIVIDFIDMDEKRNNRAVERKLKECLRHDRARIQVGHISHFGLLEMSRQRIRSSVLESSTEKCPTCGGTGHMRSVSSVALQLLRSIDEMLLKGATHNLMVRTRTEIALYLLNHKRAHLRSLEERFRIAITVDADASIGGQVSFLIEKGEQVHSVEQAKALLAQSPIVEEPVEDEADIADDEEPADREEPSEDEEVLEADSEVLSAPAEEAAEGENGQARGKRRRRRGRRGSERRDEGAQVARAPAQERPAVSDEDDDESSPSLEAEAGEANAGSSEASAESNGEGERRRRRRGRRGGRRNRRERENGDVNAPAENGHAHGADLAGDADEVDDRPITAHHEPAYDQASYDQPQHDEPAHSEPAPSAHAPSAHAQEDAAEHHRGETPAAAPEQVAQPSPPPPQEAPRRRSTVREPAPTAFTGESVMPVPMPVVTAEPPPQPVITTSGDSDRPRRSGWWSKRTLGKD